MKKTIIYLGLILMIIGLVSAVPPEPTLTAVGNISIDMAQQECTYYNGKGYCTSGNDFLEFDPLTYSLTQVCNNCILSGGADVYVGGIVFPYNNKIRVYHGQVGEINTDGTGYSNLLNGLSGGDCDIRPGTDEVWCGTFEPLTVEQRGIYKYTPSTNNVTFVKAIEHPQGRVGYFTCRFRNNDELWCIGGKLVPEFTYIQTNNIVVYSISGDTLTPHTFSYPGAGYACTFKTYGDEYLICYAGEEDNLIYGSTNIYWYDVQTEGQGTFATQFPEVDLFANPGIVISPTTTYLVGGYEGDAWGYSYDVYQLDWATEYESTPEPTPEPAPTTSGGNNAFFVNQNLAKQAEATPSQPTNIFEAIHQFILNLRKMLGLN